MIRVAFGGVAALTGLFFVWLWLLSDAVPDAFSPARATVRTLDLEQLRRSVPEPAAMARTAARLVEERVGAVVPFDDVHSVAARGEFQSDAHALQPRPEDGDSFFLTHPDAVAPSP